MNFGPLLAVVQTVSLPEAAPPRFVLTPVIMQNAVLFSSQQVTASGVGGGVGLEVQYLDRYVAQADVSVLLSLGNTFATRLAFGMQRTRTWAPAAWGTFQSLWGDRVEFLTGGGRRPSIPTWAVGLRGSALRFRGATGTISLLEAGAGTDFDGGLWLELTVIQAGARF